MPPAAASALLTVFPTELGPMVVWVITSGWTVVARTCSEKTFCTVPAVPEACTVNDALNPPVGVPDSTPSVLNVNPLNVLNIVHVQPLPQPGAANEKQRRSGLPVRSMVAEKESR